MSTTTRRPALANRICATGTGKLAERIFSEECGKRGIYCTNQDNDDGIDFITYFPAVDEETGETIRVYKNVQVTAATLQSNGCGYTVSKKISHLREDIDVVALFVRHDSGDSVNVNTGKSGVQDCWFLIPADIYCCPKMFHNYVNTRTSWFLNMNKHLKPPLDKSLEAWHILKNDIEYDDEYYFGF